MGSESVGKKKKSHKTPPVPTTFSQEMGQVTRPNPPPHALEHSNKTSMSSYSRPQSRGSLSSVNTNHARQTHDVVKHQVMVTYLYQQQGQNGWRSGDESLPQGIILRLSKDDYLSYPPQFAESTLVKGLKNLNVQAAMTIHSPVIRSFLDAMPESVDIPLLNGLAVQIIPTVEDLAGARTHQFAACIAAENLLVVWDDDALNMLQRARNIEVELMQLLWTTDSRDMQSITGSRVNLHMTEKGVEDDSSLEEAAPKPRPTIFINTILVSIALCILIGTLGLGLRQILIELMVERGYSSRSPYIRFAYLAFTPIWMFFGMFFFIVIVTNIAGLIGPISQLNVNSKHFSATCVPRLKGNLPHVTIQCPVYKEGLAAVIAPTIQSIKKAISTYELQGGSANMFVNDDGLQLISEERRQERIDFYAAHGIGWVARPKHDNSPGGFKRRGKFKKASNMNFAMDISCKLEDKLKTIDRPHDWSSTDEAEATAWALQQTVAEAGGVAWADGNIRIGDYILIIDSDTQVPSDCLLDAVSEMEASPEVAILQFSSGVMQVSHNYFENGITFFTNLVYSAINYGVANGDVAPFVGHNAILRWSALQDVAFREDDRIMFWSESHVSEDFDMALRLQVKGYITRLANWAHGGFKEGVSLTVYDELARWQKYAYGCNELVFHPIRFWPVRGPFTPLFRKFLGSNMPLASKINIISYIGTYYAIAAAWIMTLANYFIIGWYKGYIDKYYINSWNVWITLVIVFNGLGNVALATLRYRTGERSFMSALIENFKWLFMLFIFLGGISIHVSEAILAHMFEINMTWGATAKELEFSNFFIEIPKVLKNFWFSMTFSIVAVAGLVIMAKANFIPFSWHINQLEAIVPLSSVVFSHMLLPIALNPGLMTFTW